MVHEHFVCLLYAIFLIFPVPLLLQFVVLLIFPSSPLNIVGFLYSILQSTRSLMPTFRAVSINANRLDDPMKIKPLQTFASSISPHAMVIYKRLNYRLQLVIIILEFG
jgi:hypothetical protein